MNGDLNIFLKQRGGDKYYTPLTVAGGQATIINPPFHSHSQVWKKGWAKKFRIGRFYIYISNCRMKKRPIRDLLLQGYARDHVVNNKRKLYERQGGKCPHCEQSFEYEQLELHHVLPLSRFPELGQSIRNGIMLCHRCHKEVHCNPYLNIQMIEEKAKEMGIELKERYGIRSNINNQSICVETTVNYQMTR